MKTIALILAASLLASCAKPIPPGHRPFKLSRAAHIAANINPYAIPHAVRYGIYRQHHCARW
jgi:hypothetical protein